MKNTAIAAFAQQPRGRAARWACMSLLLGALAIAGLAPAAKAATTDLSNQPLATRPTVQAKPNLLFILDSSGSMNWTYMPDDLGRSRSITDEPYTTWYGYWSAQCNGVAYDPTTIYNPPLNADGTAFPNATFTKAKSDGFNAGSSTTNLGGSTYYTYNGTQPKMSWAYTSNGVISNTFFNECSTVIVPLLPSPLFTKVTVNSGSAEAQNYANWYSYYSRRYLLMRTAMGRAISALDSNYRVGFMNIYDTQAIDGTNYFRDVKDFDATQKTNFYSSLYSVAPSGGTPLPTALSQAGLYFAKKVSKQKYDPMQYSCQRNYALLSTDGYWNSNDSVQLDGKTSIGQQDGPPEVRPMRDNSRAITTTVTPWTAPATRNKTSSKQTRSITWTRTTVSSSGPGTNSRGGTTTSSCTKTGYYQITTKTQTATEKQTQQFFTPQTGTSQYTVTTVNTDGTLTSTNQSTAAVASWADGVSTVAITSTSTSTNPTTTDPIDPPASSYSSGTSKVTACQTTPVTSGPSDAATSIGSWSTNTDTFDNPVIGVYTQGTPVSTNSTSGGSPNTLADVAEYYYNTDLRDSSLGNCTSTSSGSSQDVCQDIVRPVGTDTNTKQHMNTFTIGLGTSGTLTYDRNYLTQTSGSYADLKSGAVDWPTPNQNGDATNIDDLWHAAVNGRGQYYSALNASLLADAINGVIQTVQQVAGSGAAAATSTLELVAGTNNQVYRASYTTGTWTGDLQAFPLNGADATVGTTASWSAQAILDTTPAASRKIYFNGASGLQSFVYDNLNATQKGYFDNLCSQAAIAAQCATLTTNDKTLANSGANLVNYLRGTRSYEAPVSTASTGVSTTSSALYRARDHVLGDIINGAPVHVGKPPFSYGDAGYADFVTAKSLRKNVVYVAANDGMLHAFSGETADGGTELWSFIPSAVMPNLYKLADSSYSSKHQYYVDGAPVMADIKVGTTWKTILVGGLNAGGSSYYALDITDPANPALLWEFTDANMGLSFGNPVVTKRADGTWVVAVASGYNNTSGDGKGHLYVLNANSGAKLLDLSTGVGSAADPSGLAKINTWVDNPSDNTGKRFYGGDLKGNLWRFDVDNLVAPNQAAMLLAKLQVNATTPQPITTKPELAQVSGKPVVVVGTGRYLGVTDITDATQQSIYGIKDPLTATGWGDVRADTADFVQQTFTLDNTTTPPSAAISDTALDWSTKAGWWVDLPHSGERVNTDVSLQFNTLAIATAIPSGDACASGGSSWRYFLDVTNGGVITTNPTGEQWSSNSLIVGLSWVKDSNGNIRVISQGSNGDIRSEIPPITSTSGAGSAHRTSWRELSD